MSESPKVSILIPTYNREEIITSTLDSAVSQTYDNIEIIVVDNKSTDNSFQIIKNYAQKYKKIRCYQNDCNIGPVRNWKKALDYATGEYVKILWSDDLISSAFLEKTVPCLSGQDDVGFVFTGVEIFDEFNNRSKNYFIGNTGKYDTDFFIEKALLSSIVPYSPGNALFRKKDLQKNLLIDVPNSIGSDFKSHAVGNDLLIYLLTANDYPKFAFFNEPLAFFRTHDGSISTSVEKGKLYLLYNLAKGYFVSNYIRDEKIIKKFNTLLFISLIRYKNNKLNLKRLKDFYPDRTLIKIDYFFLVKKLFARLKKGHMIN